MRQKEKENKVSYLAPKKGAFLYINRSKEGEINFYLTSEQIFDIIREVRGEIENEE